MRTHGESWITLCCLKVEFPDVTVKDDQPRAPFEYTRGQSPQDRATTASAIRLNADKSNVTSFAPLSRGEP
jgi:hypothetical protein